MAMTEKKARALLLEKKRELEGLSDMSAGGRDPVALDQQSVGRLSRMDALQMQAMAQAQERQRKADIIRIDAALKRLDTDEYGYCAECGEDISEKRLAIDPAATHCVTCAAGAATP